MLYLVSPSWADVVAREYHPWPEPHLVFDTAHTQPEDAVEIILSAIGARS